MNTSSTLVCQSIAAADAPTVLIANADHSTRCWIEATLSAAGLCAITCDSASAVRARLSSSNPSCVILDVLLPDGSGLDLQEQISRAGAAAVFVTRERCIDSCVRAIKAGAVDFLTLPCEAPILLHSLRNALQKARHSRTQMRVLDQLQARYERLTQREREVFALVCSGMLNKQVAERMNITPFTVQIHRGRVMKKMSARSFAELVRMADALRLASASVAGIERSVA